MLRFGKLLVYVAATWVVAVLYADWSIRQGLPIEMQVKWLRAVSELLGLGYAAAWLAQGGAWLLTNPGPILGGGAFLVALRKVVKRG